MKTILTTLMLCIGLMPHIQAQQPDSLTTPSVSNTRPLGVSTDGSQTEIPGTTWAENMAARSVESDMLIRRVNTPADKYTGVVDVEVPLYEMDNYVGKLPITLHYLTTGHKVQDASSDVGLGWELSAGGKIIRVVRGQPDNFEQLRATSDLATGWNKGYFEWYTRYEWDTEPDLYYYELPGLAGCFVFDGEGVAHTIPEQHLKIERVEPGRMIIYAQDGTRYYMNKTSMNSWHLWRLIYPDNSVVSFEYKQYSDNVHERVNYITTVASRPDAPPRIVKNKRIAVPVLTNPVQLLSIDYKEHQIKFNYDNNWTSMRYDSIYYCLRSIEVLWNNRVHRKFTLTQDTLSRSKFKLLSITEQMDRSKEIRPLYRFEYYSDTLPRTSYLGIDRWGYCNSREKDPNVCPGVDIGELSTHSIGADRKPDFVLTRAQSLRKILYPNGGSKEFVYELHRGINPRTGREQQAGGLRIGKIIERTSEGATPSIRRYEYSGGEWVNDLDNFLLERRYNPITDDGSQWVDYYDLSTYPVNPTTDLYGSSVIYSDVKEYLPNGSCVHYHYVPLSDLPDVLPEKYRITDAGPVYVGKETDGRTPKSTRAWGRKLLQSRRMYDAQGRMVAHEAFRYRLDTTRAVRIPGYRMYCDWEKRVLESDNRAYAQKCYYVGRYEWVCCNTLLTKRIVYASDTQLPRRTQYGYSSDGVLHKVFDTDAEGTLTTHTYRYATDYIRGDTVMKVLVHNNYLKPIEEVVYRNGKVLDASLTTHLITSSILPKGVTILIGQQYALVNAPIDSLAFRPASTDAAGNLIFDKSAYKLVQSNYYGPWNRLRCYRDESGQYHSFFYDHKEHAYPVATVTGAYHTDRIESKREEVYFNGFEGYDTDGIEVPDAKSGSRVAQGKRELTLTGLKDGEYKLTYWYRNEGETVWKRRQVLITLPDNEHYVLPDYTDSLQIDEVSVIPRNATIQTSERIGPLGIITETDARGRVRRYRYNTVGMLIEVSDEQGRILKKYTYDPKFIQL